MSEKKFKITMEVSVSGRLMDGETHYCNFIENAITENLNSAGNDDFRVEVEDIWAKEVYEEEEQ